MKEQTMLDLEMTFTLNRIMFEKEEFMIASVGSDTEEVDKYLHPIYGTVSIKGKMPKLRNAVVYKASVTSVEESKYGYTLNVSSVYPRDFDSDNINTDTDMISFIEVFIGEGTAKKLKGTLGVCQFIKEKDIDSLMEIKGIGQSTAEKLVTTFQCDAVGKKYVIKLRKLGFTEKEVTKMTTIYENLLVAYEVITKNIFNLLFKGFKLNRLDNIFLEGLNGSKSDKRRIKAYLWKNLKDTMYDGYRSYISIEAFMNTEVIYNIKTNVGEELLMACIKEMVKEKTVKVLDDKIITTMEEWETETKLMNLLDTLSKRKIKNNICIHDIDKEIDEQESIVGFKLNDGQRKAVKDIILSNDTLCMLTGFAGTGKSTVTKIILNIYAKYQRNEFTLCALSGRASSILGESSGYPKCAKTIHSTLGSGKRNGTTWLYNRNNPFSKLDVLIIDEISMIDYYMLYSILCPANEGLKIILLGDAGQLPSLSFGKTIETIELFDIQHNVLTKVMRQSEDACILQVANDVREQINPFENTKYKWYGNDVELCIGDSYEYMLDSFITQYKENPSSSIIVTTTKAKTDKINADIQQRLIQEKIIKTSSHYMEQMDSKRNKYRIYVNNHVMILSNNYKTYEHSKHQIEVFKELISVDKKVPIDRVVQRPTPIFNGEIYQVHDIIEKYVILTNGDTYIVVPTDDINCSLAYSANCHKCQGSGFNNIFVYHTSDFVDKNIMLSRQWLYTAYTRAKKVLSIHTDSFNNLTAGIRKNAVDTKVTLIEYYKQQQQ